MRRRTGERRKTKIRVRVEPGPVFGVTHDVDSHGLFLCTARPLRPGTPVRLQVELPGRSAKVEGKVRWVKRGHNHCLEQAKVGMGIQFSQECLALQGLRGTLGPSPLG